MLLQSLNPEFFSVKLAFFLRHHLVAFQHGAFSYDRHQASGENTKLKQESK